MESDWDRETALSPVIVRSSQSQGRIEGSVAGINFVPLQINAEAHQNGQGVLS
jgi:hypothetical protein